MFTRKKVNINEFLSIGCLVVTWVQEQYRIKSSQQHGILTVMVGYSDLGILVRDPIKNKTFKTSIFRPFELIPGLPYILQNKDIRTKRLEQVVGTNNSIIDDNSEDDETDDEVEAIRNPKKIIGDISTKKIIGDISTKNIIEGPRIRRPKEAYITIDRGDWGIAKTVINEAVMELDFSPNEDIFSTIKNQIVKPDAWEIN
eukprot:Lithocolla_globosa_v1_NODE_964_length_3017_cov_13.916610.p2 type:complete len:200 gc:universal NODE_964_length_3017_cov_13.916610:625-1224(+)